MDLEAEVVEMVEGAKQAVDDVGHLLEVGVSKDPLVSPLLQQGLEPGDGERLELLVLWLLQSTKPTTAFL